MTEVALNQQDRDSEVETIDFAWLEISNRCNLECTHCYANSGPKESAHGSMTLDRWLGVLRDLRFMGCKAVQVIGGEPTIHPNFKDIIVECNVLGFQVIEIYTNATKLNDALCNFLYDNRASVAFSFYSHQADIHDQITRRNGSWKRTVKGIDNAARVGLSLRAGVIETPLNRHCLEEAISFLKEHGVNSVSVDRERRVGRADRNEIGFDFKELCGRCGNKSLTIDSRGLISPCVFSHARPIGDVSGGIRQAMTSTKMVEFREHLAKQFGVNCSPQCQPYDCTPADGGGPCFPSGCDPQMCDPISCPPRDIRSEIVITQECSPQDNCSPRACSPQIGGPPSCTPHQICAPTNFPCVPRG